MKPVNPMLSDLNNQIFYQLPVNQLADQAVQLGDGELSDAGALVIKTGEFTGRSPADKFIVMDAVTRHTVDWNNFNHSISTDAFLQLQTDLLSYLNGKAAVWVRDAFVCAEAAFRIPLRVINERPSGNHFAANMFIEPQETELPDFKPGWLVIQAPGFKADPVLHGTRQSNFTILSFSHKTVLIGGTGYTGEIKKAIFSVLNFILPQQHGVLSMHCSANAGAAGDTALFFGLSGTGKTTLSSDPERQLIGDDEHGWDDRGVFNFEGGCYAKIINLSREQEPCIFDAIRPGALVENATFFKESRTIDFSNSSITENTRVSYPLHHISRIKIPSVSKHPRHIFFLSCDACGVLPPVSRLDLEQAMFYFINGYTAKIAGTEAGVKEPQLTFSACFGAPFLPLAPRTYALLLKEKLIASGAKVWLVNTGWTGGAFGTGKRIQLQYTRAMISAALTGKLDTVSYMQHPSFSLAIPQQCPAVPENLLNPWEAWENQHLYFESAARLDEKFRENFKKYNI